jgi:hypothetical protein
LNSLDPQLESAWFQPLNLSSENPVSKFAASNATTCAAASRCRAGSGR